VNKITEEEAINQLMNIIESYTMRFEFALSNQDIDIMDVLYNFDYHNIGNYDT
jgi:hypothetical protein